MSPFRLLGRSGRLRAAVAALALLAAARETSGDPPAKQDEASRFFRSAAPPVLKITVEDAVYEKWKADPRELVPCTVRENEKTVYEGVGVKVKGAIGSTRALDDRPALTLRFEKLGGDAPFHGLEKVYLNNSVQDDSLLHEWLGSELFRAAGYPAPRVTHARVWLNGRDLGMYVLKEGHDKRFLRRHFEDPTGTLYDSGLGQDIDSDLDRDEGPGPNDHRDLQDLFYACGDPDPVRARPGILAHLDVDRFLTFTALERMVCHWDGYNWNRNNYRLYFDKTRKGVFVPHGMDQLFGDADVSIFDDPVSIAGQAVMRDAEWSAAYLKRVGELLPVFQPVEKWTKRMDEVVARMRPALAGTNGPQGVGGLKTRFASRVKSLAAQSKLPAPEPIDLPKGDALKLRSWRPVQDPKEPMKQLQQVSVGGERALRWETGGKEGAGSWRTKVFLVPGKYRLEGTFMTDGFEPAGGPDKGGVWLRVMGGPQGEHLSGSGTWKPLALDFEVKDQPRQVEPALYARALKGTAYVKVFSLKLTRLE